MSSNNLIVQEYLSSLKEDTELDYLFPRLINLMGFRIVQTAKEAKGQSQYGKDIIAIGKDASGKKYRWYFELKGYTDKDITDKNFSKTDGIRESIIEAKDTAFNDSSIPEFNNLPIKIVLVHNGVMKANIKPTFDGFITREFKDGEFEFERWDIYYLTDLFSRYLFSEYLLLDDESNRLFKKTLAFLDTPDNDYDDFKRLVNLQFDKIQSVKGRALSKLFATLGLLETLVFHYSKENNNLIAAKECSKYLILYTWSWVLRNNLEKNKTILREFDILLNIQLSIFNAYFSRTFEVARIEDGLFAENGNLFERIGYPLRCFEYLDDTVYFCRLRSYIYRNKTNERSAILLKHKQKDLIIELVRNNSGFYRPVIDNQSIPIVQLLLFFLNSETRKKDLEFISNYIFKIINNVTIEKLKHNLFPEIRNDLALVIEAAATGNKPEDYCDSSSILLAILLELTVVFRSNVMFEEVLKYIDKELSLQIVSIDSEEYDVEQLLFEKHLHNEYYVDCIERVSDGSKLLKDEMDYEGFKKSIIDKKTPIPKYRTDDAGLPFLRYLAHSYFKNEILPEEWRVYINK
ncbi:hypothetical protein [Elizabethkingia meningoseptica]|uniref:hypothetical protein n=1 Tax=Elizabethkingia meningoseptica TaxID=238 RepID=UPI002DD6B5EC|nr:hypothetical protein [Elizabethkingia meningoseptica]MEC4712393.1 hypothetical protein [Elizabethkingia meningoseptica]